MHELTHWTSAESRCNRQLGKRFGDQARWAGIVADVMPLAAYWRDPRFQGKKPPQHGGHRSGGVPDNIYRTTPEGNYEQVENTSHGPNEAATDIGGKNALILGRFWYFGPSVAVLPERFNLRIIGGRRRERLSEIDESTWRELEDWLNDNVPSPGAPTLTVAGATCVHRATSTGSASRRTC